MYTCQENGRENRKRMGKGDQISKKKKVPINKNTNLFLTLPGIDVQNRRVCLTYSFKTK
jgi:hypothetical protein